MLNFDIGSRFRVAPSPTGRPHLGLIRTAYLNYLAAKSCDGSFILKIDDTDPVRSEKRFEDEILETFDWLGLKHDEFYRQSERYDRYREVAEQLINDGHAIRLEDGSVKLALTEVVCPVWHDLIVGEVKVDQSESRLGPMLNLALLRNDGSPLYNFCSVVDDIDLNTTVIIRGNDHFTNADKQAQLFQLIGGSVPKMAHVGLIHHNKKKMSKRDPEASFEYYRENFSPAAILNGVLKLGWGHPNPKLDKEHPIIPITTATQLFKEGVLRASSSNLDLNKLHWLQKKYENSVLRSN